MSGHLRTSSHFTTTMRNLHRSVLLGAMLLFCVAAARSQITEDASSAKDLVSNEGSIPTPSEESASGTSLDQAFSVEDSTADSFSVSAEDGDETLRKRRRIVAGLDNDRTGIRGVCPIRVDPTPDLPNLSSPLECARTCDDREPSKICYYRFEVEYYSVLSSACKFCKPNMTNAFCNNCECVLADGVERPILTVNRMIPGPSIEVCEGDRIVVDVVNKIEGEGLTIHWHGMFQKGTQYYDGAAFVTQCPISEATTFRYQFNADNAGTHFWHAHTGLQKMDGIFGKLIVRQSQQRDVNSDQYDYDLSHHVIIINDWMHELSTARLPGRLRMTKFQDPDSILINGKGWYRDPASGVRTQTELEVFHVKRNNRYRFRFTNALCTVCATILTIEGHNLTVIATDGIAIKPVTVNSIVSVSGERFDFVVNARNRVGTYWIQLRAIASCKGRAIQQLGILRYEDGPDAPESRMPAFIYPLPEGNILNLLDDRCDRLGIDGDACVTDLQSSVPVDGDIFTRRPDATIYLPFTFYRYNLTELFAPNSFHKFLVAANFRHTAATVGNISLSFPASPPLTQPHDIPPNAICNDTHKPSNCGEICVCTHIIDLPYNGIVELIIVDETGVDGLYHPFHLHGYAFNLMGMGVPNNGNGVTANEIRRLDRRGLLPRRTTSPPFKDTVAIPNNGYAIVRFRANNPGYWLFHCHFIYHQATGMGNIFRVGGPSDLPRVPQDMPRCGDYLPPITRYSPDD